MKTLDLFCGCGGLSFGVSLANNASSFEVVGGLDFHAPSIETFSLNHPGAMPLRADIRKAKISDLARAMGRPEMIVGGPSCQGFSTHGKRLADDPRNFLYKNFMEFVRKMKPNWVLMENVTGLLRYASGAFKDNIVEDFRSMGYSVSFAQLQAADYGIAQTRKRVFFVANRLGIPFFFPRPTHFNPESKSDELFQSSEANGVPRLPYATLEDAIGDLPWIGLGATKQNHPKSYVAKPESHIQKYARQKSKELSLHFGAPVPQENYERIQCIPRGGDWLDIPQGMLPARLKRVLAKDATTLFYRLKWDRPGYTITTVYRNVSSGAFTHPDEDRALTHREAARIQSFPDHFQFCESNIGKQIGNAVPPLLAQAIGEAIARHQSVYETIGLRNLKRFREMVLEGELADCEKRLKAYKNHTKKRTFKEDALRPMNSEALNKAIKLFARLGIESHSQMPIDLVLPLVRDRMVLGAYHGNVAGVSNASVTRIIEYWSRIGVLPEIENVIRHPNVDGKNESRVRNSMQRPRRQRKPRKNSHHLATVLYEVSLQTRCTTEAVSLVSTHE